MSNRKYPRIGGTSTGYTNFRKTCQICSKPNRKVLEIQVSWFRGDDELLNVCPDCRKLKTEDELIKMALERSQPDAKG